MIKDVLKIVQDDNGKCEVIVSTEAIGKKSEKGYYPEFILVKGFMAENPRKQLASIKEIENGTFRVRFKIRVLLDDVKRFAYLDVGDVSRYFFNKVTEGDYIETIALCAGYNKEDGLPVYRITEESDIRKHRRATWVDVEFKL